MTRADLLELERLAVRYSSEIHRGIPYFNDDEVRGHLAYLRRIELEQQEAAE